MCVRGSSSFGIWSHPSMHVFFVLFWMFCLSTIILFTIRLDSPVYKQDYYIVICGTTLTYQKHGIYWSKSELLVTMIRFVHSNSSSLYCHLPKESENDTVPKWIGFLPLPSFLITRAHVIRLTTWLVGCCVGRRPTNDERRTTMNYGCVLPPFIQKQEVLLLPRAFLF